MLIDKSKNAKGERRKLRCGYGVMKWRGLSAAVTSNGWLVTSESRGIPTQSAFLLVFIRADSWLKRKLVKCGKLKGAKVANCGGLMADYFLRRNFVNPPSWRA
jgi:hypothetical protein